jgi:hypothetical protein
MLDNYEVLEDAQVEVRYVRLQREYAELTHATLKNAIKGLSEYFGLRDVFPRPRAILVPDRSEFDRLVAGLLGVDIEGPSDPGRVAQPQGTDIVFLSPPAFEEHSTYEYDPDDFRRMVWHELVHVVDEYLTLDIEETPRWWSEGLAVYLSDQWGHDSQFKFRNAAIDCIEDKSVPDIREIQQSVSLAYDFGWTIVKFIEDTRGRESIVRAVRDAMKGDIFGALGVDIDTIEQQWKEWMLQQKEILGNC